MVRLYHVIGSSLDTTLVWGAYSGLSGRHSESRGNQPADTRPIRKAATETSWRARGT